MPLKEYQVSSYSELTNLLENTQGEGEEIFLFFSCTLEKHGDPTTKICFEAEDILMEFTEYIRSSKRQLHLIYYRVKLDEYSMTGCEVGKDLNLRINHVPTLLKWKSYQRLSGLQCCRFPMLSMVFEAENQNKFPVFQPCTFFKPKEEVIQHNEGEHQEGDVVSKSSLKTQSGSKSGKDNNDNVPLTGIEPSGHEEESKIPSSPNAGLENPTEVAPTKDVASNLPDH